MYMTNRHQSQFIGQDLLSRFHFNTEVVDDIKTDSELCKEEQYYEFDRLEALGNQRKHALEEDKEKLVEEYSNMNNDDDDDDNH
ncbi:unnamed protein product [Rotaria sp. Silwood2]|nr:unnamed protein product [Rotaria sp. Silwood2]CAF3076332.1 unnamed protein product [Rotaria sp. Silwood2]CAF3265134.1 unnamed protein product [Rotaria sp. Silwood2]CAF3335036.1 unnamed protein product [Rotaria sp. Silwood2]CAF4016814.1 unnamed protein product [Rotaria sp. Silwood2]